MLQAWPGQVDINRIDTVGPPAVNRAPHTAMACPRKSTHPHRDPIGTGPSGTGVGPAAVPSTAVGLEAFIDVAAAIGQVASALFAIPAAVIAYFAFKTAKSASEASTVLATIEKARLHAELRPQFEATATRLTPVRKDTATPARRAVHTPRPSLHRPTAAGKTRQPDDRNTPNQPRICRRSRAAVQVHRPTQRRMDPVPPHPSARGHRHLHTRRTENALTL
jgi:hypothetical protein